VHYFGELVDIGVELELVEKAGAWYSYQGERIGQGRDNACAYVETHPELATTLAEAIRKRYELDKQVKAPISRADEEEV